MSASASDWAHIQLCRLLPLDSASITQVLDYTSTLPKDAAADHLKNLLGDSPKALEFISSYNARREAATTTDFDVTAPGVENGRENDTKSTKRPQKKKPPLHQLPARQVLDYGYTASAYQKGDGEDYMARKKRNGQTSLANNLALSETPEAKQLPKKTAGKMPPSAVGQLISDMPNVKSKSQASSRTASPAPAKMKINVPGGVAGHGASTTLEDLDSAIRTLEIQTNPILSTATNNNNNNNRTCNCNATRHPLLTAAPNCLNCGKIICVKEGLGPCTFCSHPLLKPEDIHAMIESLRQERGIQRQQAGNAANRRADVSSTPKPFAQPSSSSPSSASPSADETLQKALFHRNRLLEYQSQNAQRTTVRDEAADYSTPTSGQNIWSTPAERARQLKQQQKVLREQEWNARPDYEKRRTVLSIELGKGGKVVKKTGKLEQQQQRSISRDMEKKEEGGGDEVSMDTVSGNDDEDGARGGPSGAFSRNPLLGNLVRPIWRSKKDGKGKGKEKKEEGNEDKDEREREREKEKRPRIATSGLRRRRVQDEYDDNEEWILDGGVYGRREIDAGDRRVGDEERAFG